MLRRGHAPSSRALLSTLALVALTAAVVSLPRPSPGSAAATITVTTTADSIAIDGACSLREAVIAANTDTAVDSCTRGDGADTIVLPAGTYTFAIAGTGENASATGDLDLRNAVTIQGAGAATTVVDANGLDRVFHMIGGPVTLAGLTFRGGIDPEEVGGAGILQCIPSQTLTLTGVVVEGNTTAYRGGGVFICQGTGAGVALSVSGSVFGENEAPSGGAIAQETLTSASITGSTFSGNSAGVVGGAISSAGNLTILTSTFSGNDAGSAGGALRHAAGTLTVTNSTFSGNTTNGGGGAVDLSGTSLATFTHVTITANEADADGDGEPADLPADGGGVLVRGSASLTLASSIVAENLRVDGSPDCAGGFTSSGGNLIGDAAGCPPGPGDLVGEPHLVPLANNGGDTETHALCSGAGAPHPGCSAPSPAVDAIAGDDCAQAEDQRGTLRPQGDGCDIGAFESDQAPPPSVPILAYNLTLEGGGEYAGGWTNSTVQLRWKCTVPDGRTVSIEPASADYDTTGEHSTPQAQTCTDSEGATSSPVDVTPSLAKVDKDAPELSLSTSPYVSPGWTDAPVSLDWTCSDAESGVASSPADTIFTESGSHDPPAETCTDLAGNSSDAVDPGVIAIDTVDPALTFTLTARPSGTPYASPAVSDEPVDLDWTCSDEGGSGVDVATVPHDRTITAALDDPDPATCSDLAGNTASAADPPPVSVAAASDDIAPTLAYTLTKLTSAAPYVSPGWTNEAVRLEWSCSDDEGGSGVDPATVPVAATYDASGAHEPAAATCKDLAGNESEPAGPPAVNVDVTPPEIVVTVVPVTGAGVSTAAPAVADWSRWYAHRLVARITCVDAHSGVETNTLPDEVAFNLPGEHSFAPAGACTDALGNSASAIPGAVRIDIRRPECRIDYRRRPAATGITAVAINVNGRDRGKSGVATAEVTSITPTGNHTGPTIPAPSGSVFEFAGAPGRKWQITAKVTDYAGNERTCTRLIISRSR